MPDAPQDEGQEQETPLVVHDDVVQRLLEYQARLREGIEAETAETQAAAPAQGLIDYSSLEAQTTVQVEGIVDVAAAESVSMDVVEMVAPQADDVVRIPEPETSAVPAAPAANEDLDARVTRLEATIVQIASSLADLRAQAQEGALVVDDRLAEIIERLDGAITPPAGDI